MVYIIIIGIVLWYFISRSRQKAVVLQSSPEYQIQEYEERATYFFDILKKDVESVVWEDRTPPWMLRMISLVEKWYIQLKERDKHDKTKAVQHAQDWCDFVYKTWEAKCYHTQESLGAYDEEKTVDERVDEEQKMWIPIHEIRKRLARELDVDLVKIEKEEEKLFELDRKRSLEELRESVSARRTPK